MQKSHKYKELSCAYNTAVLEWGGSKMKQDDLGDVKIPRSLKLYILHAYKSRSHSPHPSTFRQTRSTSAKVVFRLCCVFC